LEYTDTRKRLSSDGALYYMTTLEILVEHFKVDNPLHHTQGNTKRIGNILRRHQWKSRPVAPSRAANSSRRSFPAAPLACTGVTGYSQKTRKGTTVCP
jgi:hypothetical protein